MRRKPRGAVQTPKRPDRRRLAAGFHGAYPTLRKSPSIQASCDSAVAQFPGHLNSVGFLALFTCPGATAQCATVCYSEGGQSGMPVAKDLRARNTQVLLDLCRKGAVRQLSDQLGHLMDRAHAQYERRLQRATGREARHLQRGSLFRHNWSGDLLDATHAKAVVRAVAARPHISSWLYTRSFHLLEYLQPPPPNLTVWISEDEGNRKQAEKMGRRYPWALRASMVTEADAGDLVCPKLRYRPGARTPVLSYQHACATCQICVTPSEKVRRIVFPVHRHLNQNPIPAPIGEILGFEEQILVRDEMGKYHVSTCPHLCRRRFP